MDYVIFKIDDRRKHYADAIRARLGESFWFNELPFSAVNGIDFPSSVHQGLARFGLSYDDYRWEGGEPARIGQLGIWATVLKAIGYRTDPILTFEDDAILHDQFHKLFWDTLSRLPRDADAMTLFVPRDQDHVYQQNASVLWAAQGICRAYQVYGGVSMFWTPQGIGKFMDLLHRDGIRDQWDNQLYQYGRNGEMNVYTQTPTPNVLVSITGQEDSIVQESEFL